VSTPEHNKCFKVANELLTSERTYVKILYLVDQIFYFHLNQENKRQPLSPSDILFHMLRNITSLYKLHNDHLLPQLEARISNWEKDPRIGKFYHE